MKIIHYFDLFKPILGGVQTHIVDIINGIPDVEFEILTNAIPKLPRNEKFTDNATIQRIGPNDRTYYPFKNTNVSKISFPYRLITDKIRHQRKKRILKISSYDLLHVHGTILSLNFIRVDTKLGKSLLTKNIDFGFIERPKIVTLHGLMSLHPENKGNTVLRDYDNSFIHMFDDIICVDEYIYEYTLKYAEKMKLKRNIYFIPNSVDTNKFTLSPIPNNEKIKVGFAARYDKLNNIELIATLANQCPDFVELHIALSGSEEEIRKFRSICENSKMQLYPNHSYEEMPKFFQKMDVILNLRLVDGIGRTSLEAMSAGRPMIMIEGGNRYPIIHEKTGILIQNNVEDLISALTRMHENRTEMTNMGVSARKIIEDKFSIEVTIQKIKEIYETLV